MADTRIQTRPADGAPASPATPALAGTPGDSRSAPGVPPIARLGVLIPLAVATATFLLALNNGSYALTVRLSLAVAVWWAIAIGVGLRLASLERMPRAAYLGAAGLALLALFTALSIGWSPSAEKSYYEAGRVLLYLGAFVLTVLLSRRGDGPRWSDGLALGIAAVGVIALLSRLFPHLLGESAAPLAYFDEKRLSYPVNYWNGLAILVGLAFPLLLRAAVSWSNPIGRGLALAPFPALAATIYLTSSRGGVATALFGVLAFLALTAPRLPAITATLAGAAGAAGAAGVLRARHALVDGPLSSGGAASQGRSAAILLLLLCLGVALVYGAWCAIAEPRLVRSIGRNPGAARRTAAVAGLVTVVAVVVGLVAVHPVQKFEDFKRSPADARLSETDFTKSHLLSANGTGRWQLWASAKKQWTGHPIAGEGAGSFEPWWAQHRSLGLFVRDAHSVYLQTLGELGLVGFGFLALFLGAGFVAGAARLRRAPDRPTVAALVATLAGFALGAGIDWMWQLTVVALIGVVCVALLTGLATAPEREIEAATEAAAPPRRASHPRRLLAVRAAVLVVCLGVIAVVGLALLTQARLKSSASAAARGDSAAAISAAQDARRLEPWAASPYLQLALLEEQAGDLRIARAWLADALERDKRDWRLWLVSARINAELGSIGPARRSLARAKSLNPRSPLFSKSAR
jgi:O-Antigen ligase